MKAGKYILLTSMLLLIAAGSRAQSLSTKMTGSFENEPLSSVIKSIESQSGYIFMFSNEIEPGRRVRINFSDRTLKEILPILLSPLGIAYEVEARHIILKKIAGFVPVAESLVVSGIVLDEAGEPLVGAFVSEKGTKNGTMADLDGKWTLTLRGGEGILDFAIIGYSDTSVKVTADKAKNLRVIMKPQVQQLEDVVVVAYGVQAKESVVGSITQTKGESLVNSGQTNITSAIAGKLSGVLTFQESGQPGATSDETIIIRGLSSWNGSSPLVMVDGVERDFNSVDPNEVESVSVLKDASATAMYGSRGANGVILITTRTGVIGKPKMNLAVNYGVSIPTFLPKFVSSEQTARMWNIAKKNSQSFTDQYSDREIAKFSNPENIIDKCRYPNVNWMDEMLRPFTTNYNATFNITGGTNKVKYFTSVGYINEGSIFRRFSEAKGCEFSYNRINYRANVDVSLSETTRLSVRLGGHTGFEQQTANPSSLYTQVFAASPLLFPPYYPDELLTEIPDVRYPVSGDRIANKGNSGANWDNPYMSLAKGSFTGSTKTNLNADIILDQKLDFIAEGLSLAGKVSFTASANNTRISGVGNAYTYYINWDLFDACEYPWKIDAASSTLTYEPIQFAEALGSSLSSFRYSLYVEGAVNYKRTFGNHSVTGTVLYQQREYVPNTEFSYKDQGVAARITYDYGHKYLFESNLGITGSEQFSPNNRFGIFPAFAAGYAVHNEEFWKNVPSWWNKFKIRYSDGFVGSDSTKDDVRWLYYTIYKKVNSNIVEDATGNSSARWETAHKRDLGFELGFFRSSLNLTVDLYDEYRSGMLLTPIVTMLVGTNYKDTNIGSLKKHGMDIETSYTRKIGKYLSFNLNAMLGMNENRMLAYNDGPATPDYQKYTGTAFNGQHNGIETVDGGYFTSVDDIHNYVGYTSNWNNLPIGAYKYLDYNADFTIDNQDLHCIEGNTYPPVVYSFGGGLEWKNLSFSFLFYGTQGKWCDYDGLYGAEFLKGTKTIKAGSLDYWSPDNPGATHATIIDMGTSGHPMYSCFGIKSENITMRLPGVTWRQSDYLTLKEVNLSYKVKFRKDSAIHGMSITLTGNNLFTLTNLLDGDPQRLHHQLWSYPSMASVKLGCKLSF